MPLVLRGSSTLSFHGFWYWERQCSIRDKELWSMALPMLLRGDRKSSRRVVWKDNALGIRRGWYNDAMTPTERELMAEVGDEGESEWVKKEVSTRSRRARKRVQDSNLVFIWFWIPELWIYLLARHVQGTFDEDKHENQIFSLSIVLLVFLLSSFRFPANNKQSTLWCYLCARMSEF